MDDKKFMRIAIRKALSGVKGDQAPFGACIVKNGRLISSAHNTVWKTADITAHAEVNAIRLACKKLKSIDLSGCVIYSSCEPCPMCFSACHWARIGKIVFGAGIKDAASFGFNEMPITDKRLKIYGRSNIKIKGGLLRQESLRLFEAWARLQKSSAY